MPDKMMNKCEPKEGIFIGDFANEVLEIIFSQLSHSSDLSTISRVCEHFRALVLPIISRTIRLRAEWIADDDYYYIKQNELPIGLVSQTMGRSLDRCPKLCEHVQNGCFWAPARRVDGNHFDLNEYLSKPTLRTVQFGHVERRFYNKPIHTGTLASSAVTDLRFTDWHPKDVRLLASVLRSVRHLKHFMLDVRGRWMHYPGTERMRGLLPHHYGLLLQPHTASLEELVIAYSNEAYSDLGHFPRRASPVIGTLTDYHSLKRLAIPEPFLVGLPHLSFHLILPAQLEELQVQYPVRGLITCRQIHVFQRPYYHVSKMETLAKNKEEFVPRLKHVVWWFQRDPGQDHVNVLLPNRVPYSGSLNVMPGSHGPSQGPVRGPLNIREQLAEDFRKVEVKFQWVSEASFRTTPFAKFLYVQ